LTQPDGEEGLGYTKVQCLQERRAQTFDRIKYRRGVPAGTALYSGEIAMHRILSLLVASSFMVASVQAQSTAQQASTTTPSSASREDVLKNLRADMQSSRADIIAKNLTLSADQAAKFWPVFEAYQKQQNTIMDAQLKDLQKYVESYQTLDDAGALALMSAHLRRDAKMTELRQKWLGEFQKVLPPKLAVRAMQIDRRLSLLAQMEVSGQIPLVH